jgi:hypothetical protein
MLASELLVRGKRVGAFPSFNSPVLWESRGVDLRGRILDPEFASKHKV